MALVSHRAVLNIQDVISIRLSEKSKSRNVPGSACVWELSTPGQECLMGM